MLEIVSAMPARTPTKAKTLTAVAMVQIASERRRPRLVWIIHAPMTLPGQPASAYSTRSHRPLLMASGPVCRLSSTAGSHTLNMVYASAIAPQMTHMSVTVRRHLGLNSLLIWAANSWYHLPLARRWPACCARSDDGATGDTGGDMAGDACISASRSPSGSADAIATSCCWMSKPSSLYFAIARRTTIASLCRPFVTRNRGLSYRRKRMLRPIAQRRFCR